MAYWPDYLRLTGRAYWHGLLWLTSLVVCCLLQASCAYCRLLAWLVVAYWPGYLRLLVRLISLAYSGLLACLLVTAGFLCLLPLIGLAYCGLLA